VIPVHITPPEKPLGRLAFFSTFPRNPLEVIPRAVYEEDFVSFGAPGTPRVWVTAPALIKAVLLDQREAFRKMQQIRLLGPLLGKGILTSEGADWKWQRQASAPMFRPQELASFVPAFVHATNALVARWRASGAEVQPIDADMTRVTFDVISATLLPAAGDDAAGAMAAALRALQRRGGWDQLYAAMNAPKWMPRPGMVSGWRAMLSMRAAVKALLDKRRALGESGPDDLMHRLILARDPESGQSMNDEQLVDNLLTFYLAGHETTARALTWTLYLLARSPEWSAALAQEVGRVTAGAEVTAAHIDELVLVQQVLKESMRLYPPVPIMSRQAAVDTRIDGHAIAAGTSVLMPIYAIHRHAKRWEDPDAFDPARFAPERERSISRYQYMPFGAGPRICIGMAFAMMEATAILATLLQQVKVASAGDEPVPVARVTLIPKGGLRLAVHQLLQ
jgi:cytochrome P450